MKIWRPNNCKCSATDNIKLDEQLKHEYDTLYYFVARWHWHSPHRWWLRTSVTHVASISPRSLVSRNTSVSTRGSDPTSVRSVTGASLNHPLARYISVLTQVILGTLALLYVALVIYFILILKPSRSIKFSSYGAYLVAY